MYDTLIMLKPDASFTVDELHAIVAGVVKTGRGVIELTGSRIRVTAGGGSLDMDWNDAPHVLDESNEIAEKFGVASQGCRARFEMRGDDPEMELFNDYLLINGNEKGEETKKVTSTNAISLSRNSAP